jgi:hypothetical protein
MSPARIRGWQFSVTAQSRRHPTERLAHRRKQRSYRRRARPRTAVRTSPRTLGRTTHLLVPTASIYITARAEVEIRKLIHELGAYEKPTVPVLMVHWKARTMENQRGAQGEAVWEEIDPSHWTADVAGWTDTPGGRIGESTISVCGFNVLLDERAYVAPGTLVVDALDEGLHVEQRIP